MTTSSWSDRLKADFIAPIPAAAPAPAPVAPSVPEAPSWLSAEARQLWKEHAPTWHELGALGRLDVHAAALLCAELAAFNAHSVAVARDGAVVNFPHYSGVHPEAALRDNAAKRITLLLRQMGLTRASRAGTSMQETAPSPLSLFAKDNPPAPAAGRWAHLKPDAAGRLPRHEGYDPETA
jgi:P27 family predicted phage terminase small subunit